jgi:hypothetical protein
MSDYDDDAEQAAWAQLDLEARRWEEAIKREHEEFLEWVKEMNDYAL